MQHAVQGSTQIYMSKDVTTSIARPVRKASARISLVDGTGQINWANWNLQHEALIWWIHQQNWHHPSLEKAPSRMRPISQHPHPSSLGRPAGAHKRCTSSANLGLNELSIHVWMKILWFDHGWSELLPFDCFILQQWAEKALLNTKLILWLFFQSLKVFQQPPPTTIINIFLWLMADAQKPLSI